MKKFDRFLNLYIYIYIMYIIHIRNIFNINNNYLQYDKLYLPKPFLINSSLSVQLYL